MAFSYRNLFAIAFILTFVFILLFTIVNVYPFADEAHVMIKMAESPTDYSADADAVLPVDVNEIKSRTNGLEALNCHNKVHTGKNYSIIYNVMPKTGSRTFTYLIGRVSHKRSAKQAVLLTPKNSSLRNNSTLLKSFYKKSVHKATLVRGHNVFVPQWSSKILFLNTIREPIPWLNSAYYYSRYGDSEKTRNNKKDNISFNDCVSKKLPSCRPHAYQYLRFFCGDSPLCRTADEALRISKANFDSYLIVGLTEEFESFIQLVGKFLPGLYGGLEGLYREEVDKLKQKTETNRKEWPSEETIRILKEEPEVQTMYEFYNYAKTKFQLLKKCL